MAMVTVQRSLLAILEVSSGLASTLLMVGQVWFTSHLVVARFEPLFISMGGKHANHQAIIPPSFFDLFSPSSRKTSSLREVSRRSRLFNLQQTSVNGYSTATSHEVSG